MNDLTPEVIAEGRRLLSTATSGPWRQATDPAILDYFITQGPALLDAAGKAAERGRLAVELNHINDDLMAEVVEARADLARLHAVIPAVRSAVAELMGPMSAGKAWAVARRLTLAVDAVESRALPEGPADDE